MDLSIFLLLLCAVSPILSEATGGKIHEHMTNEEIESVFRINHEHIHKVEYEVVPIVHKEYVTADNVSPLKSKPTLKLKAFNRDYTLYLEKNEHVLLGDKTPMYMAKPVASARILNGQPKIQYTRIPYPLPSSFKLYHDVERRSAVTIYKDQQNNSHVDGTIGDGVVVRPLPRRVHEEVLDKHPRFRRSIVNSHGVDYNDASHNNWYTTTHHVVMKPHVNLNSFNFDPSEDFLNKMKAKLANKKQNNPNVPEDPFSWVNSPISWKFPTEEPFWNSVNRKPVTSRPTVRQPAAKPAARPNFVYTTTTVKPTPPRSQPTAEVETVYPELLITVDYDTYKNHGNNVEEVAKYVAAFWNAVDLRYRELNYPKVRLNIAGLIVPQNPAAAPYFERQHLRADTLRDDETLKEIGDYFQTEQPFDRDSYDIAVGMTHRNLGNIDKYGQFKDSTTGMAFFEGACKSESGSAAALVRDKGGFNGVTTAAHELAHTLGAPHDGKESEDVAGGPCEWSDGYLMSYDRKDSRGMHWSRCSVTAMRKFFRSRSASCLKNVPNPGTPYPKVLPGKLLSRDEQCRKSLGEQWISYYERENNCAVLWCAERVPAGNSFTIKTQYRPPAEGSYCGKGSVCIDAECVRDPESSS